MHVFLSLSAFPYENWPADVHGGTNCVVNGIALPATTANSPLVMVFETPKNGSAYFANMTCYFFFSAPEGSVLYVGVHSCDLPQSTSYSATGSGAGGIPNQCDNSVDYYIVPRKVDGFYTTQCELCHPPPAFGTYTNMQSVTVRFQSNPQIEGSGILGYIVAYSNGVSRCEYYWQIKHLHSIAEIRFSSRESCSVPC